MLAARHIAELQRKKDILLDYYRKNSGNAAITPGLMASIDAKLTAGTIADTEIPGLYEAYETAIQLQRRKNILLAYCRENEHNPALAPELTAAIRASLNPSRFVVAADITSINTLYEQYMAAEKERTRIELFGPRPEFAQNRIPRLLEPPKEGMTAAAESAAAGGEGIELSSTPARGAPAGVRSAINPLLAGRGSLVATGGINPGLGATYGSTTGLALPPAMSAAPIAGGEDEALGVDVEEGDDGVGPATAMLSRRGSLGSAPTVGAARAPGIADTVAIARTPATKRALASGDLSLEARSASDMPPPPTGSGHGIAPSYHDGGGGRTSFDPMNSRSNPKERGREAIRAVTGQHVAVVGADGGFRLRTTSTGKKPAATPASAARPAAAALGASMHTSGSAGNPYRDAAVSGVESGRGHRTSSVIGGGVRRSLIETLTEAASAPAPTTEGTLNPAARAGSYTDLTGMAAVARAHARAGSDAVATEAPRALAVAGNAMRDARHASTDGTLNPTRDLPSTSGSPTPTPPRTHAARPSLMASLGGTVGAAFSWLISSVATEAGDAVEVGSNPALGLGSSTAPTVSTAPAPAGVPGISPLREGIAGADTGDRRTRVAIQKGLASALPTHKPAEGEGLGPSPLKGVGVAAHLGATDSLTHASGGGGGGASLWRGNPLVGVGAVAAPMAVHAGVVAGGSAHPGAVPELEAADATA